MTCLLIFVLVVQIVRIQSVEMFKATLVARLLGFPVVLALYLSTRDPAFLSFAAVMGFGILTTITAFALRARDRRRAAPAVGAAVAARARLQGKTRARRGHVRTGLMGPASPISPASAR